MLRVTRKATVCEGVAQASLPLLLGLCLMLSGCSRKPRRLTVFPVKGKVTLAGKSLEGAQVMLHPVDANPHLPRPRATVAKDGSFRIWTYEAGDGAPPGHYKVTVQLRQFLQKDGELVAGPQLIPAKYTHPAQTDLHVEVRQAANDLAPIALRR
jgi:hypothetical protein